MAPLRVKPSKKKVSRLSMRGVPLSKKCKDTEFIPTLTLSDSVTLSGLLESQPYSYSLPESPVSSSTPITSPTLSVTSELWQSDPSLFLLPPQRHQDINHNTSLPKPSFEEWKQLQRQRTKAKVRVPHVKASKVSKLTHLKKAEEEVVASKPTRKDENRGRGRERVVQSRKKIDVEKSPSTSSSTTTSRSSVRRIPVSKEKTSAPLTVQEVAISNITSKKANQSTKTLPKPAKRNQEHDMQRNLSKSAPHYHNIDQANSQSTMSHPPGHQFDSYSAPAPRDGSSYQQPYSNSSGHYLPYRHSSPLQRQDSFGSKGSSGDAPNPQSVLPVSERGAPPEGDPEDLVARISSVIPDIHMLLSRSKETHGELSLRGQLLRKAEAQSQEAVKQKEEYISQLMRQIHDTEKRHANESSKYRLQIGNLEDKQKELQERLLEADKHKETMEGMKRTLEEERTALIKDRTILSKAAEAERAAIIKELEDWKAKSSVLLEAERQKSGAEKAAILKESEHWKTNSSVLIEAEKQKSAAESDRRREIEGKFDSMRKDLESKLSKTQEGLEAAIKSEREALEQWSVERETLTKSLEEERANFNNGVDAQRASLIKEHNEEKAALEQMHKDGYHDLMMSFAHLQTGMNKEYTVQIDELTQKLAKQNEEWEKEREELKGMITGVKTVSDGLEAEKGRLQKLVEGFGEVADFKGKGDAFYIGAFFQLEKQILELSNTHFNHLPVPPPPHIIANIPPNMPLFLADTPASRQLRAAYITHTISTILTTAIFIPFLFSIGRRFDQADSLFADMSQQLRSENPKREAYWRQHTLKATYRAPDAKDKCNHAATAVIEDIVKVITPFGDDGARDAIRTAVRRIVKLAVETWRLARIEREVIEVKMPGFGGSGEEDGKPAFWLEQSFGSPQACVAERPSQPRKIMLRLFPIIQREPVHESFRLTDQDINDQGMVYSHGLALYNDSPPILQRLKEIETNNSVGFVSFFSPHASEVSLPQSMSVTSLEDEAQEQITHLPPPPPPLSGMNYMLPPPPPPPMGFPPIYGLPTPPIGIPMQPPPPQPSFNQLLSPPIHVMPPRPFDPASPAALAANSAPSRSRATTPPSSAESIGYYQHPQITHTDRRNMTQSPELDVNGRSASSNSWSTEVGHVQNAPIEGRVRYQRRGTGRGTGRGTLVQRGIKSGNSGRGQGVRGGWDTNWDF
ncbi:hypothetical protein EJ08DRAFT_694997 [Tothia fuscella]|uniref:Uncharacterized protein n=1 Tax=Tothia fuscella TaxID=1048955 RepID=A0A9P4NWE2_9PEZI|nr:hypothetical protein EJ08DRAFT_694997 [Tothia fuscella]